MPVDGQFTSLHFVLYINDDTIPQTYVYAGSRYHSVDGSNRFFIAVGNHTLRSVASRDIRGTISTSWPERDIVFGNPFVVAYFASLFGSALPGALVG
jgi:hypothetical protein